MKRITKIGAICALTAALCAPAHAEFQHTDWKAEGDSLATLDTDTGLEWLKLTETNGRSFVNVSQNLSTDFSGWRLPTAAEVTDMFRNLLGEPYGYEGAPPERITDGTTAEVKALSQTYLGKTAANYAYGWFMPAPGDEYVAGGGYWSGTFYTYWTYGSSQPTAGRVATGVYLVSDGGTTLSSQLDPSINTPRNASADVSAPAAGIAGVLGLMLMGRFRRQK